MAGLAAGDVMYFKSKSAAEAGAAASAAAKTANGYILHAAEAASYAAMKVSRDGGASAADTGAAAALAATAALALPETAGKPITEAAGVDDSEVDRDEGQRAPPKAAQIKDR